ncbi:MAG: trigger factor [Leptospiraceae bacterium]|nr:MAG: trigger factor [Leptospiraceae bacterium]
MEYNIKIIEPTVAEVYFKTTREELDQAFEKAYQKAAKKLKLPGFRVGKVPIELVKKHLGDSVIEDALEILLIDTYNSILDQLNPKPISLPVFSIKEVDREKGVEFTAEYEFFPEIEISKYKKLKAKSIDVEDDPTLIDEILKSIAEKNPILLPKEFEDESKNIIEENDVVLLDLNIYKEKDNKELYHIEEYEVDLSYPDSNFPELKNRILGKKVDDEIEFITKLMNYEDFPKAANNNVKIRAKILEIKYKATPDIDDELARMFQYATLEDFKKAIKEEIEKQKKEYIEDEIIKQIIEQIIEKNPFDLPEIIIEQEIKARLEDLSKRLGLASTINFEQLSMLMRKSKEEVEKEFRNQAIKDLKTQIILDKIIELENIKATEEEIKEEIKNSYGRYFPSEEKLNELEKNENVVKTVTSLIKRKKVIEWLKENSDIKKGEKVSIRKLYEDRKIRIF